MKTKLRFLFVLLTMLWWGANFAWGDSTYEFYSYGGNLINTSSKFTAVYSGSVNKYTNLSLSTTLASGTTITIPEAMKLETSQSISFSTNGTSTVYIGVYMNAANKNTINFDTSAKTLSKTAAGEYEIIQIDNVAAGSHSITKNATDVGVYYVRVVESNITLSTQTSLSNLPITGNILLEASENVAVGDGGVSVGLYLKSEFDANDKSTDKATGYSITDNVITITHSELEYDSEYVLEVWENSFKTSGTPVKNNNTQTFTYTTASAPALTAVGPTTVLGFNVFNNGTYTSSALGSDNHIEIVGGTSNNKYIQINEQGVTLEGHTFTKYANLHGGGSSSSGCYIHFKVTGNCKITVYNNSANNNRTLKLDKGAIGTSATSGSNNTLTYNYNGGATDFYVYSQSMGIYVYGIVIEEDLSGPNNNTQASAYTWDFHSGSWGSSATQLEQYTDWSNGGSGNYYHQQFPTTYDGSYPIGFDIDIIRGLRFNKGTWLSLDYSSEWLHMFVNNQQITIPTSLTAGQKIKLTAYTDAGGCSVTATNATGTAVLTTTATEYEFTATGGAVTLNFPNPSWIWKIEVTELLATWTYNAIDAVMDESRPNIGCITFDNVIGGVLPTGTVINEVPGITYTFTKGSTDLHIASVSQEGHYQGNVLMGTSNDTGAKIVISPQVHGFISLQGNFYENCTITNTTDSRTEWTAPNHTYYEPLTKIAIPLIAGKTYELSGGSYAWELHAIAFRPAFLQPDLSAEQTTKFEATTATPKSAYPKLITAAQAGTVRFSENTWTAYLYDNNDVELNGYGDDLYVRGRVYAPAPHEDRQLNAYYLLYANVLQLLSNTPTTDATTNDVYLASLSNDKFTFTFNQSLTSLDASKVKVYKDGSTSPMSSGVTVTISGANLEVTFSTSPAAGETYRIVVEQDAVSASTAKNAEIIRTFSIKSNAEPPISMIWPTGVARVGDPIVLQTNVVNASKNTQVDIDKNFQVTGTLKVAGAETGVEITANIVANRLVFKPEQPLANNTVYTLLLPASNYSGTYGINGRIPANTTVAAGTTGVVMAVNQKETDDAGGDTNERRVLKHDKTCTFKTATSSGSEPKMTESSPYHLQDRGITYNSGTISVTFDQAVEITPYTTINATPVNGSEATASGSTALSGEAATLSVSGSNNHTICFNYGEDGLKYDLWTEVVIPANSIIGSGGKPNSEDIKFRFKMGRNEDESTEVTPESFYPHTWDFCKLGSKDNGSSTYSLLKSHTNENYYDQNNNDDKKKNPIYERTNALMYVKETDGGIEYRTKDATGYEYMQGADVKIATSASTLSGQLPEFEGIRLSFTDKRTKRFALRNLTQTEIVAGTSTENAQKNADGTDKWVFRMNGNTHYMTLSKVPAGKLYMVVNTPHLGINSPNAVFESVSGSGYELSNYNEELSGCTLLNTHGTKKVVINVTPQNGEEYEDVSFCVQNFNCEKIGVSDYSKTFKSQFAFNGENRTYATDCVDKDIRPDLVNAFTDGAVKAYYISSVSDGVAVATEINNENATATNAGTIVVYQSALSEDTNIPFFKKDVNSSTSASTSSTNLLIGTLSDIEIDNSDGKNYYFSNVYKQIKEDNSAFVNPSAGYSQAEQMGFYRALTGSTLSAHKAYLHINSAGSRKYFVFSFPDDDNEATMVEKIGSSNFNNDEWFTLQGVRVSCPKKGNLYIHNGKKVIIK